MSDGRGRGVANLDVDLLVRQAADWGEAAACLLDRIGVSAGWRVADVGCGPLGILEALSQRVGPGGEVVGIEPDRPSADIATSTMQQRALSNVRVVQRPANHRELPQGYFDLVHARSVVIQQASHSGMVEDLVRLARPGGVVATQEVDAASWLCEPSHPAWNALLEILHTVTRRCGIDLYLGRKMAELLRAAGLENVQVEIETGIAQHGSYRRTLLLSLIESVAPTILTQRLATADQLTSWIRDLRPHLENPATIVVADLLFQTWGRRSVA